MPIPRRSPVASGSFPAPILAAHLAAILGGGLALALAPVAAARWAGAVVAGTSLFALSGLLREASHRPARTPRLDRTLGVLAGGSMLLPPSAYRAFEDDHQQGPNRPDDPHRPLNHRAMLLVGLPVYVALCHRHALRTLRSRDLVAYVAVVVFMGSVAGLVAAAAVASGLGRVVFAPVLVAMTWHNLRIVAAHLHLPAGRFADTWQLVLPAPLSRWLLHADHHLEQHLRPDVRWSDLPLVRAEVDRGGFLPPWQRITPAQFARRVLLRRGTPSPVSAPVAGTDADPASPPWAGRAAIRARRRQPNHPPRDSVIRLAPE